MFLCYIFACVPEYLKSTVKFFPSTPANNGAAAGSELVCYRLAES